MTDHFQRAMEECRNSIEYYCISLERRSFHNRDDIKQELLIRMWKASMKYNPKDGEIKTYFINVIKRHVLRMMRQYRTEKNKRIGSLMSLYDFVAGDESITLIDRIPDQTIDTIGRVDEVSMINKISSELDDTARRIFHRMNSNKNVTVKDLSRELNMSRAGIYRIIRNQIIPLVDKMRN